MTQSGVRPLRLWLGACLRSWEEHHEKIGRRGFSGLVSIVDEAFAVGLDRFRDWVLNKPTSQPVFEPVDVFVFRKAGRFMGDLT